MLGTGNEIKQDITCAVEGIEWVLNMTLELYGTSKVSCLLLRLPYGAKSNLRTCFQEKEKAGCSLS